MVTFPEALVIPNGIMTHAAGSPVRRLRLLELLDLNPNAAATRELITNASKYGLTEGSYAATELKLTDKGKLVVDPSTSPRARQQAAFDLAIAEIVPFKKLYDLYSGKSMPALEVMQDALEDIDLGDRQPCVDIFVGNANHVGLLRTIGGSRQLLAIEDALDELARTREHDVAPGEPVPGASGASAGPLGQTSDLSKVCFFIAPIGDAKSDDPEIRKHRQHSDTILNQYVRRALDEQGLTVVRADEITEAGMISRQIIEYILRSGLVIADLSYHNPNVFYELCLRHVTGKPTVHLIKKGDRIPFDIGNFRTIQIGLDDVHDAIAELDTHRAEIANYVRAAMVSSDSADNPIRTYYPKAVFRENGD